MRGNTTKRTKRICPSTAKTGAAIRTYKKSAEKSIGKKNRAKKKRRGKDSI